MPIRVTFMVHIVKTHSFDDGPLKSCRPQSAYGSGFLAMPMTPQAARAPAWPVVFESSKPPWPRSSVPAWTTIARPITEYWPVSDTKLSVIDRSASPLSSAWIFPRSPMWRF
eukprot:481799_1